MDENEVLDTKAKIKMTETNEDVKAAKLVIIDPQIFARINFEGQLFQYEISEIPKGRTWDPVKIVKMDNSSWRS